MMKAAIDILEERITAAMAAVTGTRDAPAIVRPATDSKFGDYQANGVMALAKQLKTNPRKLAEEVVKKLDSLDCARDRLSDICGKPEVAGAGFINLRLKPDFIAERLLQVGKDPANFGIDKAFQPKTIVVDFSGPNIAKEMHVGHLRSTIIGDWICRMLEFLGHKVIPQNHIGDWGTQFGRAFLGLWHISMGRKRGGVYHRKELADLRACANDRAKLHTICQRRAEIHAADWVADRKDELGDGDLVFGPFLEKLSLGEEYVLLEETEVAYQYVTQLDETVVGMGLRVPIRERDPETGAWRERIIPYEELARYVTWMLQTGGRDNEQEKKAWDYLIEQTMRECNGIYRLLGVTLDDSHVRAESFYKDMLPNVVSELKRQGLAVESEGAVCVFPPGFENKEGKPLPFMIQKSDGAYLYATTDLAALRYRVQELKADRIIYVTDARQKLHFEMLFAVAEMAGWSKRNGDKVDLVHVTFGSVLRDDGTPLKTREGENVKLKDLLDEAVERARKIVEEKNPDLLAEQKEKIAKAVGIGAVKYADFSNNRTSDYVFSFDKMLAMDGNTAPYMQYAYARVKSIERKAQERGIDAEGELADLQSIHLTEPDELDLVKHLIRYGEAIQAAVADYRPNYLTAYLYELAQKFSSFYTNCPVLDAGPDKRPTRLLLCRLTARTIEHGLSNLLGIEVIERM